jgi:hypothetical protein
VKTQKEIESNTEPELHWQEFSVIQNMNLKRKNSDCPVRLDSILDSSMQSTYTCLFNTDQDKEKHFLKTTFMKFE